MDPEASRLMHIIFKEKIEGNKVSITEKMQAKEIVQNKKSKISNLARYLYDHPALTDPFSTANGIKRLDIYDDNDNSNKFNK